MAFYELRQYHVRPGRMQQWLKLMEEEIIPFQVSKGMVICGSFRGETDESVYVWIRRFESEAQTPISGKPRSGRRSRTCSIARRWSSPASSRPRARRCSSALAAGRADVSNFPR
jgi:hypothetical protein